MLGNQLRLPAEVEYYQTVAAINPNDPNFYRLLKTVKVTERNVPFLELCNLEDGGYRVVVTDAVCGSITKDVRVECFCADPMPCRIKGTVRDAGCNSQGAFGGTIGALINCDEGYNFDIEKITWSDGGGSNLNRMDLPPGIYTLTVEDRGGCKLENTFEVGGTLPGIFIELESIQHVDVCRGDTPDPESCFGSISLRVPVGAKIEWFGKFNGPKPSTPAISSLCNGNYTVRVTFGGCVMTRSYYIDCCFREGSGGGNLQLDPHAISPTSSGSADGTIDLNFTGGLDPIIVRWTGPNGFKSSDVSIRGLHPGIYCASITDGCNADFQRCFTLKDCSSVPTIEYDMRIESPCIVLSNAGSIEIHTITGDAPYSISWKDGRTGAIRRSLSAGTYCFKIQGASLCTPVEGCVTLGTQNDRVESKTMPCEVKYTCNSESRIVDWNVTEVKGCDFIRYTCTATNVSYDVPVSAPIRTWIDCSRYRFCADGSQQLIEIGSRVFGDFGVPDRNCPSGVACHVSICRMNSGDYIDPTARKDCYEETRQCNYSCASHCMIVYRGCGKVLGSECAESNSGPYCCPVTFTDTIPSTENSQAANIFNEGVSIPDGEVVYPVLKSVILDDSQPITDTLQLLSSGNPARSGLQIFSGTLSDSRLVVLVRPNPVSSFVEIALSSMDIPAGSLIQIVNSLGIVMYSQRVTAPESSRLLDVASFPTSMYTATLLLPSGSRFASQFVKY